MNNIKYVKGDATDPQGDGIKIIAHICNNIGAWGAGFVMALSKKWGEPEKKYRSLSTYVLGDIDCIMVENNIIVVNMIAQNNIKSSVNKIPPIRYDALISCLVKLNDYMHDFNKPISLHIPRIGSGLAGGDWMIIERLVEKYIEFSVTVYDIN